MYEMTLLHGSRLGKRTSKQSNPEKAGFEARPRDCNKQNAPTGPPHPQRFNCFRAKQTIVFARPPSACIVHAPAAAPAAHQEAVVGEAVGVGIEGGVTPVPAGGRRLLRRG